ncbi:MAG: small multi-drug export protein, partial [Nitriliruptoraceae bacterium]|nr:small multi-drug export protein [Nitriliruptoraceae bacterium]
MPSTPWHEQLLELFGVFLGGALPWLEAVIVIPIGILAGLPPLAVVVAGVTGNLATVWLAVVFGERLTRWWARRRGRDADGPSRRSQRAERVVRRWGMPGLAVLGPIGLGTQLSGVVAIALGVARTTTLWWIGGAT